MNGFCTPSLKKSNIVLHCVRQNLYCIKTKQKHSFYKVVKKVAWSINLAAVMKPVQNRFVFSSTSNNECRFRTETIHLYFLQEKMEMFIFLNSFPWKTRETQTHTIFTLWNLIGNVQFTIFHLSIEIEIKLSITVHLQITF